MTEDEWLTCDDPQAMVEFLRGQVSDRKLRLYACADCRRTTQYYDEGFVGLNVVVAERFADGQANDLELREAHQASDATRTGYSATYPVAFDAAYHGAHVNTLHLSNHEELEEDYEAARNSQCRLLRDIFGNPFRPVAFAPAWRTTDVMLLAQGIYDERAFDRMPILADALQDAGCDSDDILDHCRDAKQVHVRGCWVCDLVLGKS